MPPLTPIVLNIYVISESGKEEVSVQDPIKNIPVNAYIEMIPSSEGEDEIESHSRHKTATTTPVLLPNVQTHACIYSDTAARIDKPIETPSKMKLR